mgnify:CR=1 FL=1
MDISLFKIALRYIEKGYSSEDLRWGDDLYEKSREDISLCRDYYDEIEENGTNWAYEQIKTLENK